MMDVHFFFRPDFTSCMEKGSGYRKADRLAALKGDDNDDNLPEGARQALVTASSNLRFMETKPTNFDFDSETESEKANIKEQKLAASMPYSVPLAVSHDEDVLVQDRELTIYEPLSASRWYRKVIG